MDSIEDKSELLAYMKRKTSNFASYTSGMSTSAGRAMKRNRNPEDVESDEERRKLKRQAKERGMGM